MHRWVPPALSTLETLYCTDKKENQLFLIRKFIMEQLQSHI
jgi:hypothetical protein